VIAPTAHRRAVRGGADVYTLKVFYAGETVPRHVESTLSAKEVLTRVHALLAEHHGCEHIVVLLDSTRLFAVDCKGNRLPG
jgi:hypothetical protein